MELQFDRAKWTTDGDGTWLCIRTCEDRRRVIETAAKIGERRYVAKITEYRKRRSLDANAYCWALIGKIADALRTGKDEVYLDMLRRYGQSEIVSVQEGISPEGYFKYYDVEGYGEVKGKRFVHYKVYKGSSEYDSREMAILIDGMISEASEMGIETATPQELARMKREWE